MKYSHLMLEVYCDYNKNEKTLNFCINGVYNPTAKCFENSCKFLSYTDCENEIAYIGSKGLSEYDIGFGGAMNPEIDENFTENEKQLIEIWKSICKNKIDEAYREYMLIKNNK